MGKLSFGELPRQPTTTPEASLQVVLDCDGRRFVHLIAPGDTWLGSSPRYRIHIQAAGIHARHVKLRRAGSEVYLTPAGSAPVMISGKLITASIALQPGVTFALGPVLAVLQRADAHDRNPAVHIDVSTTRPDTDHKDIALSSAGALASWNDYLEGTQWPDLSDLLEAFRNVSQATAVLVSRRKLRGEWISVGRFEFHPVERLLAEMDTSVTITSASEEWRLVYTCADVARADVIQQLARTTLRVIVLTVGSTESGTADPPPRVPDPIKPWSGLVGQRLRSCIARFTRICAFAENVLVLGETGSGKELAARAIHGTWNRKGGFIAINCAAVPADLLDAELFGIESGAATG